MATNLSTSLREILAAGGEQSLIRQVKAGATPETLYSVVSSRFPNLPTTDYGHLIAAATRAVQAASGMEGSRGGSFPPLGEIPINPDLFGDEPDGRRFRVNVETSVFDDHSGKTAHLRVNVDFSTMPDFDELFDRVIEMIDRIHDSDPTRVPELSDDELEDIALQVIGIQRKW